MAKRITPETVKAIVADYIEGSTCRAVAARYSVSVTAARDYIRAAGVMRSRHAGPRARALTDEEEANLVTDFNAGVSMRDLSTKYVVGRMTVSRCLNRAGIPKQSRGKRRTPWGER